METRLFKNFSDEVFTWTWDSVIYTFEPGKSLYLEDWKAEHFAKHLVDREMHRANLVVNHFSRPDFYKKCFDDVKAVAVEPKNSEIEILNKNIEEGKIEAPKKKGKVVAKKADKPVDADFEGLAK